MEKYKKEQDIAFFDQVLFMHRMRTQVGFANFGEIWSSIPPPKIRILIKKIRYRVEHVQVALQRYLLDEVQQHGSSKAQERRGTTAHEYSHARFQQSVILRT